MNISTHVDAVPDFGYRQLYDHIIPSGYRWLQVGEAVPRWALRLDVVQEKWIVMVAEMVGYVIQNENQLVVVPIESEPARVPVTGGERMKLYLASPIFGMSYDEVVDLIQTKKLALSMYQILSPMTGKNALRTELKFKAVGYEGQPVSNNHAIFERDKWMVGQADVIFADLVGSKIVSIGTVMELAWAALLGKHTVVAMEMDNIHRHCFVIEAADVVFETSTEAIAYLKKLAGGVE